MVRTLQGIHLEPHFYPLNTLRGQVVSRTNSEDTRFERFEGIPEPFLGLLITHYGKKSKTDLLEDILDVLTPPEWQPGCKHKRVSKWDRAVELIEEEGN